MMYDMHHHSAQSLIVNSAGERVFHVDFEGSKYIFLRGIDQSRIPQSQQDHYAFYNSYVPQQIKLVPELTWHAHLGHLGRDVMQHLKIHTNAVITEECITLGGNYSSCLVPPADQDPLC